MSIQEVMRDKPALWEEFEYHESNKAYELLDGVILDPSVQTITHAVYAFPGDDKNELITQMIKVLECLARAAIAKKPEGCEVGEGRLVVYERMAIEVHERHSSEGGEGKYMIRWRGKIDRI